MKTTAFWILVLLAIFGSVAGQVSESEEEVDGTVDEGFDLDTATVGEISGFYLWSPKKDAKVKGREIKNGDKFCPKMDQFSIEAKTKGSVGSVYMKLLGPFAVARLENQIPWFLGGNSGDDIFPVKIQSKIQPLVNGEYTLYAEPYTGMRKGGDKGEKVTVSFIIDCPTLCRRC